MWVGDLERTGAVREAAEAARAAPPGPDPPRAVDLLLDAIAIRQAEGFVAAAPLLTRALEPILALNLADQTSRWLFLPIPVSDFIALELWDAESWHALAARQVQFGRDGGPRALAIRAQLHGLDPSSRRDMTTAALLLEEQRVIGTRPGIRRLPISRLLLAAWRGRERQASELIEATVQEGTAGGLGRVVDFAIYGSSVLYNSLGRHDAGAKRPGKSSSVIRWGTGPWSCPSWPRLRAGPVTLRCSEPHSSGWASARV